MSEVGNFGLARRDLESGEEQVFIVTPLPVERDHLTTLALERDEREQQMDPNSNIRWFVVRVSGT
ncbi:hypothetical protein EEDFHM_04077 [Methylorubrum populi]